MHTSARIVWFNRVFLLFFTLLMAAASLSAQAAQDLPPFKMPKVAAWPKQPAMKPIPAEKEIPALTKEAEAGNVEAQYQLSRYYGDKDKKTGAIRDKALANQWNIKAAEGGNRYALLKETLKIMNENRQSPEMMQGETLMMMTRSAEAGSSLAAYLLGKYYQSNEEVEKDMPRSVYWYRMAVQAGYVPAALELGKMYYPIDTRHFDVYPNIVTSYVWSVIAQKGYDDSTNWHQGRDIDDFTRNIEKLAILQFLMLPSEKKQADAILATWPKKMPPEARTAPVADERGESRLSKAELAALEKKANAGDKNALRELVMTYSLGKVYVRNHQDLLPLLMKASAQGIDEATNMICYMTVMGRIEGRNKEKSYATLHKQAVKGDSRAYYYLGLIDIENQNNEKAIAWFEKGAARGNADCMTMLGYQYRQEDRKKAAQWYENAAKAGSDRGLLELIGIAESDNDVTAMAQWAALLILRTDDPMLAYNSRKMLAYLSDADPFVIDTDKKTAISSYHKALIQAEKWHKANPLKKKIPAVK